jgi:hypothetical protein
MTFGFSPKQVIHIAGRWYQVASVRYGAVGQCNVIGLYSLSERGNCAVEHTGEMFTPEDVLLAALGGGITVYSPMETEAQDAR